jgi:xylan 1,4-beta-xylosidase
MSKNMLKKIVVVIYLSISFFIASTAQTDEFKVFQNPIIPGFHPDPSICRVGDDFYLVTSSFEFFPGVPVFHSKDLVHWEQIGYCLTRESQLPLSHVPASGGIYAPTIRYHDGIFYMVTTNVNHGGNFFVTTSNPASDWSDPIWLDQGGIDPSFFFDEDGKTYLQSNGGLDGIYQSQIDIKTGKRISEIKHLWSGTGGRYPEGPHVYKKNGWYYLMIAEGGTEYGHMETMARSKEVWGPFEECPNNPILTHRNKINQSNPIQATGHADLTDAPDGSWWLVCLGFRISNGMWHHLGRESFLAPVQWNNDGWPIINNNGSITLDTKAKLLPSMQVQRSLNRYHFDNSVLSFQWNYLRNPFFKNYSLDEKKGFLTLIPTTVSLDSSASPTFIARRQEHFTCEFTTLLEYEPKPGSEAGICCYMNPESHYDLGFSEDSKGKFLFLRLKIGSITDITGKAYIQSNRIILKIKADPIDYTFLASSDDGKTYSTLGKAETRFLSSEVAGGFTGVYFGLYTFKTSGEKANHAYFNWVEYSPAE